MNLLRLPATTALGLTTIILMIFVEPLTKSLAAGLLYHLDGPASFVILPILIIFLGLWLFLTLGILWVRRHPRFERYFWLAMGLVIAREILEAAYLIIPVLHNQTPRITPHYANVAFVLAALLVVIAATVHPFKASPFWSRARAFFITVLGFVALSGLLTLAQLALVAWKARDLNTSRPLHTPTASVSASLGHNRIVWIVFDELSYQQLYEHRFPGLQMPAFDRLAAGATVFTNVRPADTHTEVVLPILMTGIPISLIRNRTEGFPLGIMDATTKQWGRLDPHNTVFQDALDAGYSTAVAGWYNPYCRIVASVLDHCYWVNSLPLTAAGLFHGTSLGSNLKNSLEHLIEPRAHQVRLELGPQGKWTPEETALHQKAYLDLRDAGDKDLNDPSITFLMIHLPIPHPGGIYDRQTASFSKVHTTYIDNLALCDLYLAHIRQEMEANGTWDNTSLVIMGDHSWRASFPDGGLGWSELPDWTAEEQLASEGGAYDARPGYIVKLAGQHSPARVDASFPALRTRQLLDALLHGTVTTPDQLVAWASREN